MALQNCAEPPCAPRRPFWDDRRNCPFFFSLFRFRFGQFPVRAVYLSSACFSAGCRFRCLFSCPCDLATTDSTAYKARAGATTVADGVDARGEGERKEGSKEKRKHVFAFAASAAEVPVETAEGGGSALLSFCQHCSLCPPAPSLHDPRPSATSAQDPARAAQLPIHRRFLHPRLPIDRSLHSFDAETEKSICTSTTQHAPPPAPATTDPRSTQHSSVCLAFFRPILDYISSPQVSP